MMIERIRVATAEEKREPNQALYQHWESVFRSIPGFEQCVCLMRVRCPNRPHTDMDFFLLNPAQEPKIGLVECEGFKGKGLKDKSIAPAGVKQLLTYLADFIPFQGKGKDILEQSIRNAFSEKILRGKINRERWSSMEEFVRAAGCRQGESEFSEFIEVLDQASRNLIPILLYYRETPLAALEGAREEDVLFRAFAGHRFYMGAVRWPEADKLLGGRYFGERLRAGGQNFT